MERLHAFAVLDADASPPSPAAPLAAHLKEQGVEFIQFAFRWMNCLLMRELSVKNIVRMWDTYLVRPPLSPRRAGGWVRVEAETS